MWKITPLLLLVVSCSLASGNFQSRYSPDLEGRNIRRIAVMPLEQRPVGEKARGPSTPFTTTGPRKEDELANALSSYIYSTMTSFPQWHVVSEREVREVLPIVLQGSEEARPRKLGELVHADAVISSRVLRYRERVGEEWGAKSPASVTFVVELWDVRRGDIVWSGRFDETQRPLSENIFAFGDFTQRGARWLKADELALEGVKKAVAQLHQVLYRRTA